VIGPHPRRHQSVSRARGAVQRQKIEPVDGTDLESGARQHFGSPFPSRLQLSNTTALVRFKVRDAPAKASGSLPSMSKLR
jgi:hypothetical protein